MSQKIKLYHSTIGFTNPVHLNFLFHFYRFLNYLSCIVLCKLVVLTLVAVLLKYFN